VGLLPSCPAGPGMNWALPIAYADMRQVSTVASNTVEASLSLVCACMTQGTHPHPGMAVQRAQKRTLQNEAAPAQKSTACKACCCYASAFLQRQNCCFGSSRHCLTCVRGRDISWPKEASGAKQLFTPSRTCTLSSYYKLCTAAALQIYGSSKVPITDFLPTPTCKLFFVGIWACAVSRAGTYRTHLRQLRRPAARETAGRTNMIFAINEQRQCSRTIH